MADEIIAVDSDDIDSTQFIRTTDAVKGDAPGSSPPLSGPVNVAFQKIINSLLYLKNRVDGLNLSAPNASTTQRGIVELATAMETRDGASTSLATTPAGVAAAISEHTPANATMSVRGVVLLARNADADNENEDTRSMTPQKTHRVVNSLVPAATTGVAGKIEKATVAEVTGLVNDDVAVTPSKMGVGLRGSAAQADATNRGTAKLASQAAAAAGTNNTDMMTALRTQESIDENAVTSDDVNEIIETTQAAYDALTTPDSETLYVIVN